MQPYFLPYIGYFQLIAAADLFIVYDNIKYTKKGWINRNRMLLNGADSYFTLPLKSAPDSLDVVERELAPDFNRGRMLNQFAGAYAKAPHYRETMELLEQIIRYPENNLFRFLDHSIRAVCERLGIRTRIQVSSEIEIDHRLKGQDKVMALCLRMGATEYLNPIGGVTLYSRDHFERNGVALNFIKSRPFEYNQFGGLHVPWLSIVDVLMFNPLDKVQSLIASAYDIQ